jgi:hypothetical protein
VDRRRDLWVVDSTPVECPRSREAAHRSELAGWAEYGYCASHSRYFWGPRLHLLCALHGRPVGFAVSGVKADEREVLLGTLEAGSVIWSTRELCARRRRPAGAGRAPPGRPPTTAASGSGYDSGHSPVDDHALRDVCTALGAWRTFIEPLT